MTVAQPLDIVLPLCRLGEGAHWDPPSGKLYWVDISDRRFYTYHPTTKRCASFETGLPISFVLPVSAEEVWLGLADGIYSMDMVLGQERRLAPLDLPDEHRLNDGKCDPSGRLWVGTINTVTSPSETAAVYRLDAHGFKEIEGGYMNANSKAWSPDGHLLVRDAR